MNPRKTNKSYTKRLKVTRTGKLIARAPGQNHFNAKQSGQARLGRRRGDTIEMTSKSRARFVN